MSKKDGSLSMNTETIQITGSELADRFIGDLESAGFNPYMFNEGLADKSDVFHLTLYQCTQLGMSKYEFEARLKNES